PPDRRRAASPVPHLGRRGRAPRPVAACRDRGGDRRRERRSRPTVARRRGALRRGRARGGAHRHRDRVVGDVTRYHQPRRYPRMARVNEVVREALGDELERLSDPRLGLVTITGVEVSPDLRQATVYYSALGRAEKRSTGVVPELAPDQRVTTHAALQSAAPHL